MKRKSLFITMITAGALALSLAASEVDQLKSELVGHTMGGREKTWKFQSRDQIKELVIKNKTEDARKRIYVVALQLQAAPGSDKYAAEAKIDCWKAATGWKVDHVGLLSLKKIE